MVDCSMKWLINLLNKKALKNYKAVNLSIGTIYLKPLTNGMVNKAKSLSYLGDGLLNDAFFFQLMDYNLTNMSKAKIDDLSVTDGQTLREAVRDVLMEHGVIKAEVKAPITPDDKKKLEQMKRESDEVIRTWQSQSQQG